VEEGKQDDAQVLFGRVVLARETDCTVWLVSVDHIDVRISPDRDNELIVLVLHNTASIHAF
jgi:hypothetical protein